MRYFPTLFILILSLNAAMALPNISSIAPNATSIGQFNKLELTIAISNTNYTNPYDFTVANGGALLRATFTSPSGVVKTIDGFYLQEYAVTNITNGSLQAGATGWKARFTPNEVGNWAYSLTFQDASGVSAASNGTFSCVASTNKGFVRRQTGKNYFKFDNNTQFIPNGQNVCWYGGNKLGDYKNWLDKMSANKSNYFRLWFCYWGIELEWTNYFGTVYGGLKNYKQDHAFEVDWLVDYAAQNGMYIDLCLQNHGQFDWSGTYSQWGGNPYNNALGGMCSSPMDYWVNSAAKATYKNKLRYILARWGYSPNIACWELFNEMNLTQDFSVLANKTNAANWAIEMAQYLKDNDPNIHLVSNSYHNTLEGAMVWNNANFDWVQTHIYNTTANIDDDVTKVAEEMIGNYNKPYQAGEFGIYVDDPSNITASNDPQAAHFHNTMWATLFSGSAGPGSTWWWDNFTDPLSIYTYPVFKQVANFVDNHVNTVAKNYSTYKPTFFGVAGTYGDVSHSAGFNGFATGSAVKAPQSNFTLLANGTLSPAASNLNTFLFNSYHPAGRNPPTFNVNYPTAGTFKVTVVGRGTAGTTALIIVLDGTTVLTQNTPSNGIYSINVPAGNHTIKVDNAGQEWINVSEFKFTNYIAASANIYGNALKDNNHVVGWFRNTNYTWLYLKNNGGMPPPSVSGASVQFDNLSANKNFNLRLFNPVNNTEIINTSAISNGLGVVNFNLPTFNWDLSFRLEDANVVPVELVDFHGKEFDNQQVMLNWLTASEVNIKDYEIERSNDAARFKSIGTINSKGNKTAKQLYAFKDLDAQIGINYYRLKINELNSSFNYSKVIAINLKNTPTLFSLAAFPNPTISDVQLRLELKENSTINYTLINAIGQIILLKPNELLQKGEQNIWLKMSDLPNGIYFLNFKIGEMSFVKKIVKE
jgi:sporulation protein YlmC with PRC-barrel domain